MLTVIDFVSLIISESATPGRLEVESNNGLLTLTRTPTLCSSCNREDTRFWLVEMDTRSLLIKITEERKTFIVLSRLSTGALPQF
ncbi:unnamed protein product [Hymenolepis diminuta]|uniref:Uncharacterized protein n=1 Tax=Hymenolepis diminuta TaxID=6216 RepID=A0A0R3SF59_HYMDI|nr:unnamed protein product [Hymenolepis diminuta]VUZ43181.1 unnamed protein product [Hymenolepis diminuta]